MTCLSPPELDDVQLLAYLDGTAEQSVSDHLRECPHCLARAARLQQLEGYLAAAYYRRSCPSLEDLGEYELGLVDRQSTVGITRHLAECPHCAREVAQLRSFLGDLAPAPRPSALEQAVEQVRVMVPRLIGGVRGLLPMSPPALAPAFAGVRGGGPEPLVYEAEGVQVIVGAQRSAEAGERFVLLGLITGIELVGWTAYLWQDGNLIAAVPVDEGGNFTVRDLASASYEIVLSGPGQEIYIEELKI